MSTSYIGFVWISLKKQKFNHEDKVFIDNEIGQMIKKSILNEAHLEESDDSYYFELSGDNGIDYSHLEKIRDKIKDNYKTIEIQVSEYADTGDGFYFGQGDV